MHNWDRSKKSDKPLNQFEVQGDILSDKGTFVGQGDICRTRGHFLSDKGTFLSDKGTFSLKSVFGLLWAGGGRWRHGTTS